MPRPSPWQELSSRLAASRELGALADAGGEAARLPLAAAAWVFSLVAERRARPLLVVVPHEADAHAWLEAAELFDGDGRTVYFPAPALSPYQESEVSLKVRADEVLALARVLDGSARVVVTTPRALFRRLATPREGVARLTLARGERAELEQLVERLAAWGYRRSDLVSGLGEFAVRGGLLDVFPPGFDEPLRVDFAGDEVESLRRFEVESQRSDEELPHATLLPLALFPAGREARAALAARLRELTGEEAERETAALAAQLAGGAGFPGWENFLPLVADETATLADWLAARGGDRPDVVAVDRRTLAAEVEHHASRLQQEFETRRAEQRLAIAPEALEHPPAAIAALIEGAAFRVGPLLGAAPGAIDFAGAATDRFHGQLPRFPREIETARARGERCLVVAPRENHARLVDLFAAREIPEGAIELVAGELERGFRLPAAGVAVYGETQLVARGPEPIARRARKPRYGPFLASLRDLKVGDFVVHVDHGIGQFVGLRTVAGGAHVDEAVPAPLRAVASAAAAVESEVMELAYSSGKTLLVPLARLDLIQKYSGIEGVAPRLDQLGGTSWNRTKTRVKKGLRDMASELLKLYAERELAAAPALAGDTDLERQFEASFPYEETPDQSEAIRAVYDDLAKSRPMDRLLVGDVGFGKTEVAMRAAFRAVDSGFQVVVLAPTTILADQHLEVFQKRFEGFAVSIARLSRSSAGKDLRDLLAKVGRGEIDVLVGTHRVLSRDLEFARLGLVIVDEEQRFGVAQKERLKQLKRNVHVLAMTATPLPRTLQLSLAGVRDLTVIETPPKDRMAVETAVLPFTSEVVREAIEFEVERGGQVFYVYNRVESIEKRAEYLRELLPELRITIGHGQLEERELARRMHAFTAGEHDLLLATTIIENGIDIPSVNTMIVERADRFGLAQLYQLRGRVGRSRELGYCYLLVPADRALTPDSRARLEALQEFTELGAGFRIAGRDLEIRGAGNLLGAEQSGHIAALGIETYLKMLEETVREMKGETVEEAASVTLDLPVAMAIPKSYIADANLRMEIYRKLATAEQTPEEMAAELADRFGPPPAAVRSLLEVAALKYEAERLRVQSIAAGAGRLTFRLRRDARIDVDRLIRFVAERPGSTFSPSGVLTLELVAGSPLVATARAVLQELAA
jgi:transcription-repair coupling factor (superfamily II helicase)